MRRCYILIYSQIWLLLLAVLRCYFIAAVAKNRGFPRGRTVPWLFFRELSANNSEPDVHPVSISA